MKNLSFVIPCYNSESTIEIVVSEIKKVMEERSDLSYEIILISDASPDNVYSVIKKLAEADSTIKGIEFSRNFGQHASLMAGYRASSGEIIISLDDDGQTPVNEVFRLIDKLEEGYDVVYAEYDKIAQSLFRVLGSKMNKIMMEQLISKPKHIVPNSFFVCRKFVIDDIINYDNPYPYIGGLVFRATKHIANVRVNHRKRLKGQSGYNFLKLFSLWMNGFTAFSTKPLRISNFLGLISACFGFIIGVYTIINKLINPDVLAGYSSLMAVLLFIGGILMLILGMMGEYMGRIYISLNNAPQYVIRNHINLTPDVNSNSVEYEIVKEKYLA